MAKMMVYNYRPDLKISNLESLAHGTGCTVLECIIAHTGELIAKQWRRGEPYAYDAIIRFPGNRFYKPRDTELAPCYHWTARRKA